MGGAPVARGLPNRSGSSLWPSAPPGDWQLQVLEGCHTEEAVVRVWNLETGEVRTSQILDAGDSEIDP